MVLAEIPVCGGCSPPNVLYSSKQDCRCVRVGALYVLASVAVHWKAPVIVVGAGLDAPLHEKGGSGKDRLAASAASRVQQLVLIAGAAMGGARSNFGITQTLLNILPAKADQRVRV